MSLCHECGSEVAQNDAFCPFCGIRLEAAAEPVAEEVFESTIVMSPSEMAQTKPPGEAAGSSSETESGTEAADREAAPDPANVFMAADPDERESLQLEPAIDDVPFPSILAGTDEPGDRSAPSIEPEETEYEGVAEIIEPEPAGQDRPPDETNEEQADSEEPEQPSIASPAGSPDAISKPLDELEVPEERPSVFDSVRIMEGDAPVSTSDAVTRIPERSGASAVEEKSPAETGAVSEGAPSDSRRSGTGPGIGGVDTDGRKSAKLKPLSEGTILNGRYEIVRKIGGGGMGAVYLASDNNLGGVLRAVKEMIQAHIEEEQQEKSISDFKRESMILSTLDHPSVPTIYDYFYDAEEGRFYLVMKYISGGDLSGRLRAAPEGKIEEQIVTGWAIQIIDVLDYLHSQPTTIVYRDLKPSNVMLDGASSRVMLIDFGIARSIGQKEEKGVTAVGTMGYAPPELFSGNVEPRSDIYSLGSTMFHLLTGADPQSNPLLIFDFQKNPRPRQINPRLSDQMERILMRAVEYNADARFDSAREFKAVLEDHLANLKSGNLSYGVTEAPVSVSLANQVVFCGFCGQRIVATDLFCAFCGAKQPIAQQGVHSEIYHQAGITARLVIEGTSELSAPTYSLQKDENLVGRRDPMSNIFPEVDLSKYDPQTKISRRHAKIWRDGQEFLVEDLGSSNGTILEPHVKDSFRLTPNQPHRLTNGDRLKIGDTTLHFVLG